MLERSFGNFSRLDNISLRPLKQSPHCSFLVIRFFFCYFSNTSFVTRTSMTTTFWKTRVVCNVFFLIQNQIQSLNTIVSTHQGHIKYCFEEKKWEAEGVS